MPSASTAYRTALLRRPELSMPSALGHVYCQPDDKSRCGAQRKQEREALPGVPRSVDDRLDHVRPDDRRRAIRQPEESEELYSPLSEKPRAIAIAI